MISLGKVGKGLGLVHIGIFEQETPPEFALVQTQPVLFGRPVKGCPVVVGGREETVL